VVSVLIGGAPIVRDGVANKNSDLWPAGGLCDGQGSDLRRRFWTKERPPSSALFQKSSPRIPYKVGLPPFEHDPDDLILKFPPGAVVRCVLHEFHGGEFGLLAIEEIPSP
jgi:hypothetical protein